VAAFARLALRKQIRIFRAWVFVLGWLRIKRKGAVHTGGAGMSSELINQFLTPLIFSVFALGFAIIWYSHRRFSSAGVFAISYLCGAFGFIIEASFEEVRGFVLLPYVGDIFYIATATTSVVAFYLRYDQKVPLGILGLVSAVMITGITWYRFVDYQVETRVEIISYGCGVLLLMALPAIKGRELRAIDRLLFWLVALFGAQFFVTTYLILTNDGYVLTIANLSGSVFLAITNFIVSALSLSIAVTLFVKYGMDIILVLQAESHTDDLTRLLNRRGFERSVSSALWESASSRTSQSQSLVVCDLDHFKTINDKHGHVAGDMALRGFAGFLSGGIRQSDLLGRVGGEEFCMLLHGAGLDLAQTITENLRAKLEVTDFFNGEVSTRLTASFGVAEKRRDDSYETLFKRADAALYRAKQNGRNRVEVEV